MKKNTLYLFLAFVGTTLLLGNSVEEWMAENWRKAPFSNLDDYFDHFKAGSSEKIPATVEEGSADEGKNPDPFNSFVLSCDQKLLDQYPESKLRRYLENHGEIARVHALFLLARKRDKKAVEQIKILADSSKNNYVAVYAEKLRLIKMAERGSLYISQLANLDDFFKQLPKGSSQNIPETKKHEGDDLKDPINYSVIFCSKQLLDEHSKTKLREYLVEHGEVARVHAIFLLARKDDEEALKEIKQLVVSSKNGFVRMHAVQILGELKKHGDKEIVKILIKALDDPFEYMVGDVSLGVGAESVLPDYGIKATPDNGKWKIEETTANQKARR